MDALLPLDSYDPSDPAEPMDALPPFPEQYPSNGTPSKKATLNAMNPSIPNPSELAP
jgi:hypothetical protein